MSIRAKYRMFLYSMLIAGIMGIICLTAVYFDKNIPDNIIIRENNEKIIDFNIPFTGEIVSSGSNENVKALNLNKPIVFKTGEEGSYQLKIKLFGVISYKNVNIDVISSKSVYACGNTIGIYLKSDGILVVDTGSFVSAGREVSPSREIIRSGDYITAVNGNAVNSKNQLIDIVEKNRDNPVILTIRRNSSSFDVKITPAVDETGKYKLGLWVKDDCQGIGTLTYIDENGRFGALGHGICDADTGTIVEISGGMLYQAKVLSVIKGKSGTPGEYVGTIDYSENNILGFIESNGNLGIYGVSNGSVDKDAYVVEAGYKYDAKKGPAVMRTSLNGTIEEFEIEILELDYSDNNNKGIVFKVTDEALLQQTNGIVQGQSGSPIIQDGKLIGAVTHVFVNDSTMGYGIFLETMLNAEKQNVE